MQFDFAFSLLSLSVDEEYDNPSHPRNDFSLSIFWIPLWSIPGNIPTNMFFSWRLLMNYSDNQVEAIVVVMCSVHPTEVI